MEKSHQSIIPGALLILIGTVLLCYEFNWIPLDWYQLYPIGMICIGLILVIWGIMKRTGNGLFWGIVVLGAGIFFALRNYDFIRYYSIHTMWPVFAIILGIAFLSLFILNRNDWGVLIPAVFLLFFGSNYFLEYFDYWRLQEFFHTYWPISLIVAGIIVVVVSLGRKRKDNT